MLILGTWKQHAPAVVAVESPVLCTIPGPPQYAFGDVAINRMASWTFEILNGSISECDRIVGGGVLEWSITVDPSAKWITVTPSSGTTTTERDIITVTINTTGLAAPSTYNGKITITSNGRDKPLDGIIQLHTILFAPEDVNRDGAVTLADLRILVANFRPAAVIQPRADVNGDGVVDVLDLATVGNVFRGN